MASSTGLQIIEELLHWGIIVLLGESTANNANEGQITDTVRLQSVNMASTMFDDAAVRITEENDSTSAQIGAQSVVDYLDAPNGILYCNPNFTAGSSNGIIDSGLTYQIFRPGVDPDDVDRARDNALTDICSQWYIHPLSEIANAGYVDDLGAGNWEDFNSVSTVKEALVFPQEFARDSLRCSNSATNSGVESASIYPRPNAAFYLWVPVSAQTGTAEVIVRDVTNNTNITLSGTSTVTGRGWTAIEVTGNVPDNCFEITIRLLGQGASDVIVWGPICFHWQEQRRIGLPARVISREWVGPIQQLRNQSVVDDNWGQEILEEVPGVRVEQVSDNVQVRFDHPLGTRPYFYTERAYYSALSATYLTPDARAVGYAASTLCPRDYVVPAMVSLVAGQYRIKQPWAQEFWDDVLIRATQELAVKERMYGPQPKARIERARQIGVRILRI